MKKLILLQVLALAFVVPSYSQKELTVTPFLHQTGMYYSSDFVTSEGFGLGFGIHALHKSQVAGQADVNILWGNGNAITTRLALGYEKKGKWTPGIYATVNMIWGQRTEMLNDTGEEPPVPAWGFGLRITPLKFRTTLGYLSALEFGYGLGPDKGRSIEFSILAVGMRF